MIGWEYSKPIRVGWTDASDLWFRVKLRILYNCPHCQRRPFASFWDKWRRWFCMPFLIPWTPSMNQQPLETYQQEDTMDARIFDIGIGHDRTCKYSMSNANVALTKFFWHGNGRWGPPSYKLVDKNPMIVDDSNISLINSVVHQVINDVIC